MNLSDPNDALYTENGIAVDDNHSRGECSLCGCSDCTEPQAPDPFGGDYKPSDYGYRGSQVGGDHYSKLAIQPGEYALANNLNYWQSNVIKYVTRYRDKGGAQDLDKAIHCLQMLKEAEYGPSRGLPNPNPEP